MRGWFALGVAWMMVSSAVIGATEESHVRPFDAATDARIDVFFTPDDDATAKIVSAIVNAKRNIRVQAYLFTSRKIANALIRAHRAGIAVELIVDKDQMEKDGTPMAGQLAAAGIPVYVDGFHAAAHNKIILIDAASETPTVITGSYNLTVAAQTKNAENVLLIRNDRRLAASYEKNYDDHRGHSIRMQ